MASSSTEPGPPATSPDDVPGPAPAHRRDGSGRLADGLVLGIVSLTLYVLLGQETLYNRDAHVLLQRLGEGVPLHDHHFAYFPAVRAVHLLLAPLHASLHEAARAASALGTAIGVVLVHHATARLASPPGERGSLTRQAPAAAAPQRQAGDTLARADAALVTVLVATCPAVVFFATVVEVHGPFFAAFGLAALATANMVTRPRWSNAVLTGAAFGLAYTAHATATLLPFALLPTAYVLLRRRAQPAGRAARLCVLAAAVQGVLVLAVPVAIAALGPEVRAADAAGLLAQSAQRLRARPGWPGSLPALVATETWKEWLWPAMPLSLAWLAAFARRALRARAGALLLGMVPYLALVTVVLPHFPEDSEHGAYLLPLVWPAALLVVASWPRRMACMLAAAGLVLALVQVTVHDRPERSLAFARGLRAAAGGEPAYLLLGDYHDLEALHVRLPDVDHVVLVDWVARLPATRAGDLLATLDAELRRRHQAGQRIYLTRGTEEVLRKAARHGRPDAGRLLEALRERWSFVRVHRDGFEAWRLAPR